ncbi:uncharacterized protein SCHCODRAFT_02610985 [Schizophyllum commune H4-8]|uniref:uncharacterized protein n=1 Tax=Schizophyllum commune (strain H4-8 / FGSC 9210) TaxID=578458 RepID=UPI00215E29A1|nr:uncharacterized protein SCHCODRAFT_02610985 [Schizophyllum commune H4-8]KAI5898052.1 hypothetical protein SCHCODRAFT_02610985 [Schizophyllum commune H4-8]
MDASIGDPFVLATYASQQKPSKGKQRQALPHVYATYTPGPRDGYVTATGQGDGIHTLDVSEIHPVTSHTFGPSTLFAGPSVARCAEGTCSTYTVVAASSDISADEGGRTIWKWEDDLSGSIPDASSSSTKLSATVPHLVSTLHVIEECPSTLFAWSPSGHLSLLDNDLKIRTTRNPPSQRRTLVQASLFPSKSCGFVPSQVRHENDAIAVCLEGDGAATRARILAVRNDGDIADVADLEVSVAPANIASCSIGPTGFLTILARDGTWHAYQISCSSEPCLKSLDTLKLRALSFIGATISKSSQDREISLVALSSSHVLLAATSQPSREVVLHIWDLSFSVLLASQTISLPSALADEKKINVSLSPAGASQAVLVLSPSAVSTSSRSTVYVVPYTCPPTSTIAHAMGRAEASRAWLALADATSTGVPIHDAKRAKLLKTIESSLAGNRPQAADEAFRKWYEAEKDGDLPPALGHAFVRDVLNRVLRPEAQGNVSYSPEIVKRLIEAGAVSAGMVEGSALLTALRKRNDWASIQLALENVRVRDIPETELIEALAHVIALKPAAPDANAMQVDTPTTTTPDTPTLPTFLALCVAYTSSQSALRVAIRRALADAPAVLATLDVLQGWLARHAGMRSAGLAPAPSKAKRKQKSALTSTSATLLPDLPSLLRFLTALLDATYVPVLLQHAPAGKALRKLAAQVAPEIEFLDEVGALRGPLEPFVRAQEAKEREKERLVKGKGQKEPQGDWRQRRRAAHEAASAGVGLYRLEELTL